MNSENKQPDIIFSSNKISYGFIEENKQLGIIFSSNKRYDGFIEDLLKYVDAGKDSMTHIFDEKEYSANPYIVFYSDMKSRNDEYYDNADDAIISVFNHRKNKDNVIVECFVVPQGNKIFGLSNFTPYKSPYKLDKSNKSRRRVNLDPLWGDF